MGKKHRWIFKYGQLTAKILNHLVDSLLAGYSAVEARHGLTLSVIIEATEELLKSIKDEKERKRKVWRALKNLEKREIIDIKEEGEKVYVKVKDKNHPKIIEYSIKALLDFKRKKKKWDGRWFLVFFDVPELQRNKRNFLRSFLKRLGFYPYQQSVYIFPYECKKEVGLIKKIVEAAKYVRYAVATEVEEEEKIKRFFNLD